MRSSNVVLLAVVLALAACETSPMPFDAAALDSGVSPGSDSGEASDAALAMSDAPEASDGGVLADAPDAAMADAPMAAIDAGTPTDGCGMAPGMNDRTWTLMHGGRMRAFAVHLPPSYDPSTPLPVVLDFHGRNSNAAQQVLISDMRAKADLEGFIAVHPTGIGQTWNGGLCCGEAMSTAVDDVGFVRALLDRLQSELCVDATRVYASGLSNGGFLVHRLACEMSDRIAAVASVAGPNGSPTCTPGRAVPVMHFHGTADTVVPYNGFGGVLAVRPTMTDWAERDGCGPVSASYYTNGDVTCEAWEGCRDGASVRLCTITGGGHQWPGGFTLPLLGPNTTDISATDAMWTFFQAHSL